MQVYKNEKSILPNVALVQRPSSFQTCAGSTGGTGGAAAGGRRAGAGEACGARAQLRDA